MRKPVLDSKFKRFVKEKRLLRFRKDSKELKLSYTKYGEPVLTSLKLELSTMVSQLFYVDGLNVYTSLLQATIEGEKMEIGDVKVLQGGGYSPESRPPFGRGYGTILMHLALKEARKRGVKEVYARRRGTDKQHIERQHNYYAEFGFAIDRQGRLSLQLPEGQPIEYRVQSREHLI